MNEVAIISQNLECSGGRQPTLAVSIMVYYSQFKLHFCALVTIVNLSNIVRV